MKSNIKYTALEILKEVGIKNPENKIGKMRVRIAGISGIVKPDHLIKIQTGTKEIDILVGEEVKKFKFNGVEKSSSISKLAKEVLDKQSKKK
jgi:hypothetical protein